MYKLFESVELLDGRTGSIIEIEGDIYLVELDEYFDKEGYFLGKGAWDAIVFAKKRDIKCRIDETVATKTA
jgi:hypothetical protein